MLLEPGVGAPCEDWDSRKRDGRDMALPEMLLKPEMGMEAPWLLSTLQFSNVSFRLKLSGAEGQEIMGYRPLCEAEQGHKGRRGGLRTDPKVIATGHLNRTGFLILTSARWARGSPFFPECPGHPPPHHRARTGHQRLTKQHP